MFCFFSLSLPFPPFPRVLTFTLPVLSLPKREGAGGGGRCLVALFKESLHEKLGIRNSIFELSQTRVNVMSDTLDTLSHAVETAFIHTSFPLKYPLCSSCLTLTAQNNIKALERMTCHYFQWPIRRDLRSSFYTRLRHSELNCHVFSGKIFLHLLCAYKNYFR